MRKGAHPPPPPPRKIVTSFASSRRKLGMWQAWICMQLPRTGSSARRTLADVSSEFCNMPNPLEQHCWKKRRTQLGCSLRPSQAHGTWNPSSLWSQSTRPATKAGQTSCSLAAWLPFLRALLGVPQISASEVWQTLPKHSFMQIMQSKGPKPIPPKHSKALHTVKDGLVENLEHF